MAATLEELGEHGAAMAQLGLAVNTYHDAWVTINSRGERYDKLRRDPRAATMLARLESL
jgi:hypothetical protein